MPEEAQSRKLSIIVVNYNTRDMLRACLQSIREHTADLDPEIIVIDNASPDGSADMVRCEFSELRLIANTVNTGYTRAINRGIIEAHGEYYLILNADTEMQPDSVQEMLRFMEDVPDAGIVGPRLIFPDGQLQLSCRTFYTIKTLLYRRTPLGRIFPHAHALREHLMADWDHATARSVDWVLGGCMMVRREAIVNVGMMDERYFLYLEDVDWSYRMQQYGWKVYYLPGSVIVHHYRQGSRAEHRFNKDVIIHLISMLRYVDKWNRILYLLKKYLYFIKLFVFVVTDLIAINAAFFTAHFIRGLGLPITHPHHNPELYLPPLIILNIIIVFVFYMVGLYRAKFKVSWVDEVPQLLKGIVISALFAIIFVVLSSKYKTGFAYSRAAGIGFLIFAFFYLAAMRLFLQIGNAFFKKRHFNMRRLLVVGYDETARALQDEIANNLYFGYEVAGFLPVEQGYVSRIGYQILGSLDHLFEIIERERITEVIFVNVQNYFKQTIRPLIQCQKQSIDVKVINEESPGSFFDPRIDYFLGFPAIHINHNPLYFSNRVLKRSFDFLFSFLMLLILSPLLLAIGILMRISGTGPVLEKERVVGKEEKPFNLWRFRSEPEMDGTSADGRFAARLRRFLHHRSLDEAPQLINILLGQMGTVGPRPVPVSDLQHYQGWHRTRFEVKPGLTGLWQIHMRRKWKFDEMVMLDIHYIQNWSLFFDLQILLRTLPLLLFGKSAERSL